GTDGTGEAGEGPARNGLRRTARLRRLRRAFAQILAAIFGTQPKSQQQASGGRVESESAHWRQRLRFIAGQRKADRGRSESRGQKALDSIRNAQCVPIDR